MPKWTFILKSAVLPFCRAQLPFLKTNCRWHILCLLLYCLVGLSALLRLTRYRCSEYWIAIKSNLVKLQLVMWSQNGGIKKRQPTFIRLLIWLNWSFEVSAYHFELKFLRGKCFFRVQRMTECTCKEVFRVKQTVNSTSAKIKKNKTFFFTSVCKWISIG